MSKVGVNQEAEGSGKELPALRAIDTAAHPHVAPRDPSEPISPALNYHRGDSSRSGTSNGGTIPEYRADDDQYQSRVNESSEGNMRQRLPYSPGSGSEDVEATSSDQGRSAFSSNPRDKEHRGDGRLLHGVHKKSLKRTGLMSKPSPRSEGEWIRESDEVTEWLPLFYGESASSTLSKEKADEQTWWSSRYSARSPRYVQV
jgi:hypothetical protein